MSLGKPQELVMDREAWRMQFKRLQSRTWLSDWTELNWRWFSYTYIYLYLYLYIYIYIYLYIYIIYIYLSLSLSLSLSLYLYLYEFSWLLSGKKILPANAGDTDSTLGSGKSPEDNLLCYPCLGNPRTEELGRLQSMGSQKSQIWIGD